MSKRDSPNSESREAPHRYFADDGRQLISVTQALALSRVIDLSHYPDDPSARMIGSAVHAATAYLDIKHANWDDIPRRIRHFWDSLDPMVANYVHAWETFKMRADFYAEYIELRLCPTIGQIQFGMTLDRAGMMNGKPAILDIKCSQQDEPWWGIQLAGYELGLLAEYGPPKARPYKWLRYGVRLMPNAASEPYRLELFDDPADHEVFKASLVIAVWRRNCYGVQMDKR